MLLREVAIGHDRLQPFAIPRSEPDFDISPDKTRKPGKAPVPEPIVAQLVERTLGAPPAETTHWTSRAMANVMKTGIVSNQLGGGADPAEVANERRADVA